MNKRYHFLGIFILSILCLTFFAERTLAAEVDYSSLPMFYYSSGTGEWETELAFSGDGSFEGKYYKEESDKTGNGYLLGTRKEADFYGRVGKPEKISEYEYKIRIEELQTRTEPKSTKIENNKKIIYTTPFGLRKGKELRLYLPGKKTTSLPKGFQTGIKRSRGDNKLEMFLLSYGIYSSKDKSVFLGEASKEVREKFKRKAWKIKEDKRLVKVRKKTKKRFKNIGYGYQRLKIDSKKEYDFSRSGYRVNIKKGKMRIYDKEGRVQKLDSIYQGSFNTVDEIFVSKKDLVFWAWDENTIWGQSDSLLAYFSFKDFKLHEAASGFTLYDESLISPKDIFYKGMILYSYQYSMNYQWTNGIGYLDLKTKKKGYYELLDDTLIKGDDVYFIEKSEKGKKLLLYKEKLGGKNKKLIGEVKGLKDPFEKGIFDYEVGAGYPYRSIVKINKNEIEVEYWTTENPEWIKKMKGKIIRDKK